MRRSTRPGPFSQIKMVTAWPREVYHFGLREHCYRQGESWYVARCPFSGKGCVMLFSLPCAVKADVYHLKLFVLPRRSPPTDTGMELWRSEVLHCVECDTSIEQVRTAIRGVLETAGTRPALGQPHPYTSFADDCRVALAFSAWTSRGSCLNRPVFRPQLPSQLFTQSFSARRLRTLPRNSRTCGVSSEEREGEPS